MNLHLCTSTLPGTFYTVNEGLVFLVSTDATLSTEAPKISSFS